MAISYTELAFRSTNTSGQTSWVPSLGSSIPAGALGMLVFDNSGGTAQPTSVVDSHGNNWTNLTGANDSRGSLNWVSVWYFYYTSAPGATTLTVSFASSNETFGSVGYFTDTSATPADASGASGGGVGTTPSATTSGNRTADNELIVWLCGCSGGSGTPAVTVPSGYTEFHTGGFGDGVRVRGANFGYLVDTGGNGSTASGTGALGVSRTWSCSIATFAPAAAGGTTDTFTVSTTGTSTPGFGLAGMTDTFTVSATGHSAPSFGTSGTDVIAIAATGHAAPAFTLTRSGLQTLTLATAGRAAPSFALAGMVDLVTWTSTGTSAPSFGLFATNPAATFFIQPLIARGLIPGLDWRTRSNRN